MKYLFSFILLRVMFISQLIAAQQLISGKKSEGYFPLISKSVAVCIYTDINDYVLIQKSASLLRGDIENVTGREIPIVHDLPVSNTNIIIIGTQEKCSLIHTLLRENLVSVTSINNRWEAFQMQAISHPFKNIAQALIIMGSDRRGAAFGVFEFSKQIGVSPWYWWADVPVKRKKEIFIRRGLLFSDFPKIKYRGIFLNDEAPALSGWAKEKFGGFNHLFYEKVFELILRLKGNYLWPAMWGNAFYDDDTLNIKSADDFGIVIGTSHHEPMMRAHDEWRRYGHGAWNYDSNSTTLREFWEEGINRVGKTETIVSIGMRGDGDKAMTEGTAISLLEKIVKDQRNIIKELTHKPASETPQLWALYKEVQDYYDKGMRVPDDITLLFCDDNWGNIRRLPKLIDKPRRGGYGIYYHFDYVGDPRNYKWINTNNISRVWEQMHLAFEYGVKNIWIVNVGDLKPMELPINFFLDYAWNPGKWNAENITNYYSEWTAEQFGKRFNVQIANIVREYSRLSAMRKPELLSPGILSLRNYHETGRIINEFEQLSDTAEKIYIRSAPAYKDAYFELVLHPIKALSNLYKLYSLVAENRYAAAHHYSNTNILAEQAKQLFIKDSLISKEYNNTIAAGKWSHMMDQTHIGYTNWQQPPYNTIPETFYLPGDSMHKYIDPPVTDSISGYHLVPQKSKGNLFYEKDGVISIQSVHFSKSISTCNIQWKVIKEIGKDCSGITSFPVTTAFKGEASTNPRLEYDFYSYDSGSFKICTYFSPTLNFSNDKEGLRYAMSVDDNPSQIISINKDDTVKRAWEQWVADNIIIKTSAHNILKPGKHVIKYWLISPAVILQKIVVDFGGLKPSYLGPPETIFKPLNK